MVPMEKVTTLNPDTPVWRCAGGVQDTPLQQEFLLLSASPVRCRVCLL
jgi:hypothetical protein